MPFYEGKKKKKDERNENSLTKAPQIIHIFSYKSSAIELVAELFPWIKQ